MLLPLLDRLSLLLSQNANHPHGIDVVGVEIHRFFEFAQSLAELPRLVEKLGEVEVSVLAIGCSLDCLAKTLEEVGFTDIQWTRRPATSLLLAQGDPMMDSIVAEVGEQAVIELAENVWSYTIEAVKA